MTANTSLDLALTLPGAREHHGRLQIRLPHDWKATPGSKAFPLTDAGALAAIAWRHEQARLHELGATPNGAGDAWQTLAEASAAYRVWKVAKGNTRGQELAGKTLEWYDHCAAPWEQGELALLPVRALPLSKVEAYLARRGRAKPRTAANERAWLLNVLRHAQRDGVPVRPELLTIAEVAQPDPKPLRVADPCEIPLLIAGAPDYARRHVRLLVTTALRISESFHATDDWLDLELGALHVPAWATKERRDKTVALDVDELHEVRLQLLERPALDRHGDPVRWLFPRRQGGQWTYEAFRRLVWVKVRRRAADAARELGVGDPGKLSTFRCHELRATGCTIMIEADVPDEVAAARVGHSDGGKLLRRRYLEVTAERQRREIDALPAGGLLAAYGGAPAATVPEPPPARRSTSAKPSNVVPLARKATSP